MAKASDLIGRSGAGGIGPIGKPGGIPLGKPSAKDEKEAPKAGQKSGKDAKPVKGSTKGKGGAGATTSPSVRPKV